MKTEKEKTTKDVRDGAGHVTSRVFELSEEELVALLKYWMEDLIYHEYFWFANQPFSCSSSRRCVNAAARAKDLSNALNDDDCAKATIDEVWKVCGKRYEGIAWRVFRGEATPEEEARFREEQARLSRKEDFDLCQ